MKIIDRIYRKIKEFLQTKHTGISKLYIYKPAHVIISSKAQIRIRRALFINAPWNSGGGEKLSRNCKNR